MHKGDGNAKHVFRLGRWSHLIHDAPRAGHARRAHARLASPHAEEVAERASESWMWDASQRATCPICAETLTLWEGGRNDRANEAEEAKAEEPVWDCTRRG